MSLTTFLLPSSLLQDTFDDVPGSMDEFDRFANAQNFTPPKIPHIPQRSQEAFVADMFSQLTELSSNVAEDARRDAAYLDTWGRKSYESF